MKKIYLPFGILCLSFVMMFSTETNATRYSVDVRDFEFSPANILTVKVGDTVHFEWKNGSHTTTSTTIPAGAAPWDAPMDAAHVTFNYIPALPGVYHYKCTMHESSGMVGQFTVLNSAGIGQNDFVPKITVYPNPVRNRANLVCTVREGLFIQHLVIYDIAGKRIMEFSYSEGNPLPDHLDLSSVPEGMLMFEFTDNLNRSYVLRAVRKD
jgi:plastocyanin